MGSSLGPGIHEGVGDDLYHALPYASNSRLSLLKRSPAHLAADIARPHADTEARRIGRAIHAAILEPELFVARYARADGCTAALKSGKRKGQPCGVSGQTRHDGLWYCGKHEQEGSGDEVEALSQTEWDMCEGLRASLLRHAGMSRMFDCDGCNELTVIWDDGETGVRCKARIDRLIDSIAGGIVLDLKTTPDARADAFQRSIFRYGYFRQLPLYQEALAAHGVAVKHLVIAALEKDAPYAVAGYRLAEDAADAGREDLRRLLRLYAECRAAGEWPAYPPEITEITLPIYAWDKLESAA